MECLELVVGHAGGDDRIDIRVVVVAQPIDEVMDSGLQRLPGRYRDETGVQDGNLGGVRAGCSTDDDLGPAKSSGLGLQRGPLHESALQVREERGRQ